MSLGAERRMENRRKKLEDMIKDPRSAINLESLLIVILVKDTSLPELTNLNIMSGLIEKLKPNPLPLCVD